MSTATTRFRLKHLLIAVALVAVLLAFGLQIHRAARRAKIIDLLNRGPIGSQTDVVEDGDIVLLKSGQVYGAIKILRQIAPPNYRNRKSGKIDYQWWYREDGSGRVFENVPQVKTGKVTGANEIRFGPFQPGWSGSFFVDDILKGVDGFGYIASWGSTKMCVVRTRTHLKAIDAASDEYDFGEF